MAGALAPVVWLMVLASVLFGAAGWLDGIYPDGPNWSFSAYGGLGWTSYAFGLVNLLVALLIARGSERSLILRLGLSAFFVVERTTTAFFPVQKADASIAVHLATAVIEAVILTATWRVWRLGQQVTATDLAALALPQTGGPVLATAATGAESSAGISRGSATAGPLPVAQPAAPRGRGPMARRVAPRIAPSASRGMALLVFILVLALIADAVVAGIVPGVTVDLASPDWLGYLYAFVVLVVAAAAVGGRRLPLRLLLVVSVILFLERAFTPFLGAPPGTVSLALHLIAAVVALVLAVVCAAALRSTRLRHVAPS